VPDRNRQNAWGIAFPPGGPFWVKDNNAGLSTLYLGNGTIVDFPVTKNPFAVVIPGPKGSSANFQAAPTGIVWTPTAAFTITDPKTGTKLASNFIFDTEDGTISTWSGGLSDIAHAVSRRRQLDGARCHQRRRLQRSRLRHQGDDPLAGRGSRPTPASCCAQYAIVEYWRCDALGQQSESPPACR
jgi:hypothetical protein